MHSRHLRHARGETRPTRQRPRPIGIAHGRLVPGHFRFGRRRPRRHRRHIPRRCRSPQDIEEQVTYPLSVQLQGLAGVKAIRSSSEPNFSMINIIFDERTDFYFARNRVLERLTTAQAQLPAGVTPVMAPDATALGQIFWYTVEGEGKSLDELRAIQDWTVRYQLNSIPGVSEVASVGGFVREYQVDVDPARLRIYDIPLSAIYSAIASSNMSVGGKAITTSNSEYLIRSIGWIKGIEDLENVVVS